MVKVIASSIRKGNVLEIGGKLCAVMKADNIHPGKGTPVTHLEMRRIADGVKITERYRTTEQVEKAFMEERTLNFLYEDDTAFHFMDNETYDQYEIGKDIVSDNSVYLQENMPCQVSLHEGVAVAIEVPQRVTMTIAEADPVVKGQTASSSYKPAITENGLKVMVPPYIASGERIVIRTEDGEFVERAKD
ncbi:MAG: elongation factor P [Pseudomonadota bacterium]